MALALFLTACGGEVFTYGAPVDHGDADIEAAVADDAGQDGAAEAAQEPDAGDSGQVVADAGQDAHETGSGDADAGDTGTPPPPTDGGPCTHSDGIGQTYQDCAPLGTYNSTTAYEACAAYSGSTGVCSPTPRCPAVPAMANSVCYLHAGMCACWDFSGASVGHVSRTTETVNGCTVCTTSTDPTWD